MAIVINGSPAMGLSLDVLSSIDSLDGECVLDEILELVDGIENEVLRGKVKELLVDPPSDLDAPALDLEECPAGAFQHHSYSGGLLQHTIGVTKLSLTLCDLIEDLYGGRVNRDYVIAGAVLHDVMKVFCYEHNRDGRYRTSDFGGKVDHLTLVVGELIRRDFPIEVVHIAASHHGDVGPTKPKSVEALIVSVADLADSDLNGKLLRGAEYLLRRTGAENQKVVSSVDALNIVGTRDREGWDGLRRLVRDR